MRHSDYDHLLPTPIKEKPYNLSFIVVQDKESGKVIYKKNLDDDLDDTVFEDQILPQITSTETQEGDPEEVPAAS